MDEPTSLPSSMPPLSLGPIDDSINCSQSGPDVGMESTNRNEFIGNCSQSGHDVEMGYQTFLANLAYDSDDSHNDSDYTDDILFAVRNGVGPYHGFTTDADGRVLMSDFMTH